MIEKLKLLQIRIQPASEFSEAINPGLKRSTITNHSPSEIAEFSFTKSTTIDDANCMREQLHLDHPHPSAKPPENFKTRRLLHVPIRLANFDHILRNSNLQHSDALLIPLATFSCVSASSCNCVRSNIDERTTQSQEPVVLNDIVLECSFCNASIPLTNLQVIARVNNNAKLTVEVLDSLAAEHAEGCRGRKAMDLMNADDTQFGISESTSEYKHINNFIGTSTSF